MLVTMKKKMMRMSLRLFNVLSFCKALLVMRYPSPASCTAKVFHYKCVKESAKEQTKAKVSKIETTTLMHDASRSQRNRQGNWQSSFASFRKLSDTLQDQILCIEATHSTARTSHRPSYLINSKPAFFMF